MSTHNLTEFAMTSSHKSIDGRQDHELTLAIEVAPARRLKSVAKQRSAAPHIAYVLDVSGSMNVVTDDASELVEVGQGHTDGQLYTYVQRRDGQPPNTLLNDMMKAARSSLGAIKSEDLVSIMPFSSQVGQPQRFTGTQRDEMNQAIQTCDTIEHEETNLKGALSKIRQSLSADQERPRCVALFTDGMPDAGTERQVLDEARRCADSGIPVHVCAFGDQLSLDFLSEISAITGGQVSIGRDQEAMLRQLHAVVKDAQETGLTDLVLELSFDQNFLPQELFRGKPQNQLLMKLKPNQRQVRLPIGNLNAGSWQTFYVRGKLLGCGQTSGQQPVAHARITFRRPQDKKLYHSDLSYAVQLDHRTRVDRVIRENMELTLLKSLERDLQQFANQGDYERAKVLAAQLVTAYRDLSSPEGEESAAHFQALLEGLSKQGKIDMAELQQLLNHVSESSSTSSSSQRFGDGSGTNVSRAHENSDTFAGHATGDETRFTEDQPNLPPRRPKKGPARREVLHFDI